MANRNILAIGTSAGGVEALIFLAARLQRDLSASVFLTIHLPMDSRSSLDEVLARAGPLPAAFAKHGDTLRKSHIYIAPPDRHLLVDGDRISLGEGPRENNARPAIDPMLRSAAVCCGSRAIGVVLTGTLGDGASGLWTVRQSGGITVVQDPKDAAFAEMPLTALPRSIEYEVEIARTGRSDMEHMDKFGRRSVLACPDCGGVMWELEEGDLSRFRCHVGHTYTAEVMSLALDDNLRHALASAVRALEERTALARKLYNQARSSGHRLLAATWAEKAKEFERETEIIRDSTRRMDRLAAQADIAKQSAAE